MIRNLADSMMPQPYRVMKTWRETRDTFTLAIEPADGGEVMSFAPGQFNMLYQFGVGEVPISISSDPAERKQLLHTIRAVGSVTNVMRKLKRGDVIGVRGPFGSSWPVEKAKGGDLVIVAGGLGMAPLRPAWLRALAHREAYGRITLIYGARTPQDLLYLPKLRQWQKRSDLKVQITVDAATGDWRDNVGVVTTLIPKTQFDPQQTIAMMCGPEAMMRFVTLELIKRGVEAKDIFLSLERNMKCAVGFCGHCQFGPHFVCKDGAVISYDRIQSFFSVREL